MPPLAPGLRYWFLLMASFSIKVYRKEKDPQHPENQTFVYKGAVNAWGAGLRYRMRVRS